LGYGLSDGRVTAILLAIAFLTGAAGTITWWLRVPECLQFYVFLALFLLYYQATTAAWARWQTLPTSRMPDRRHQLVKAAPSRVILRPDPRQNEE
jgi:hypothetical protein